jgi:hypothetical protein
MWLGDRHAQFTTMHAKKIHKSLRAARALLLKKSHQLEEYQ